MVMKTKNHYCAAFCLAMLFSSCVVFPAHSFPWQHGAACLVQLPAVEVAVVCKKTKKIQLKCPLGSSCGNKTWWSALKVPFQWTKHGEVPSPSSRCPLFIINISWTWVHWCRFPLSPIKHPESTTGLKFDVHPSSVLVLRCQKLWVNSIVAILAHILTHHRINKMLMFQLPPESVSLWVIFKVQVTLILKRLCWFLIMILASPLLRCLFWNLSTFKSVRQRCTVLSPNIHTILLDFTTKQSQICLSERKASFKSRPGSAAPWHISVISINHFIV